MLADLKTRLADLDRAVQAVDGRDDDLAGMVAGLNRAFGALRRVLEEEHPGTAARLIDGLRGESLSVPGAVDLAIVDGQGFM